jgi:uncharacterized protein (TIGR00290 family)
MSEPIVMCFSGGKDSVMTLYELKQKSQFDVVALITTVTESYDRISMHGVRRTLLLQQASSLGIPLQEVTISPHASNAEYEEKMGVAFVKYREQGIRKVAFGDIFLEDLKEYREDRLGELHLECLFPIWKRETRELVETFIDLKFRAVTSCVDPKVIDQTFAGRLIDAAFLASLPEGVDPCGENGEFHSFVFDGPIFEFPIPVTIGEIVSRDSFLFCDLVSV